MRFLFLTFIIIGTLSMLVVQSCDKAKEPAPADAVTCDSKPSTYANDVKPIVDLYCKVCHQPGGSYQSLPLTNYSEVKTATDSGNLLKTIKHAAGIPAMPQGGQKLSDANIAIIECWINKGFLK